MPELQVLILEDRADDAELIVHELKHAGFHLTWQQVETEAEFCAALTPSLDVILADYSLPQYDALRALRYMQDCGLDIPFIVVTGTISEEVAVDMMKRGATDYLLKDRLARLGAAVTSALEQKSLREQKRRADQALLESEDRYRLLFDTSIDAIFLSNPTNGSVLAANSAACQMFGRTEEEICRLGRTGIMDLSDPRLAPALAERARLGRFQAELTCIRKDGTKFPCEVSSAIFKDKDGNERASVIIRDITERKQAEEALRLQAEITRNMIEGICLIKASDHTLIYTNPKFDEMFGYAHGELLGQSTWILNADQAKPSDDIYQILDAQGNTVFEILNRKKDSTFFWSRVYASTYQHAEYGKVYLNVREDITERKHAEQALRESEEKFRSIFENSLDGITLADEQGNIVVWNGGIESLTGLSRKDTIGRPLWDVQFQSIPLEKRTAVFHDRIQALIQRMLTTGETPEIRSNDEVILRTDGTYRVFQSSIFSIQTEKGFQLGGITRDVTERKQRERELQAIASVSAALGSASTRAQMLPTILDEVNDLLHADGAALIERDPGSGDSVVELARGEFAQVLRTRLAPGEGISGLVITSGKPFVSADIGHETRLIQGGTFDTVRAVACVPLAAQGNIIGALWIGRQTEIKTEEVRLLTAIADIAANALHRATLHEQTRLDAIELALAYDETIEGWSHALDLRDRETEGHTQRVTEMTLRLARAMGMTDAELVHIRRGALLHDIGKMGIPDSILLKPGTLNDREWEIMRRHPEYAKDLLSPIDYLRPAIDIPYCHHEKWDGTGYPRGLRCEEIPLAARLFAIVDVWDALCSDRPYRSAWSHDQARDYIRAQSGSHFDPKVVEAFLAL